MVLSCAEQAPESIVGMLRGFRMIMGMSGLEIISCTSLYVEIDDGSYQSIIVSIWLFRLILSCLSGSPCLTIKFFHILPSTTVPLYEIDMRVVFQFQSDFVADWDSKLSAT